MAIRQSVMLSGLFQPLRNQINQKPNLDTLKNTLNLVCLVVINPVKKQKNQNFNLKKLPI